MKRILWAIAIAATIAALLFQGCINNEPKPAKKPTAQTGQYTCAMHSQILQDHPGNCPICGMKLIKKNKSTDSSANLDLPALTQPKGEFVITTLPVTTPITGHFEFHVKSYGTIESDTRAAGSISSNISGRIEKLYLRYRYQKVDVGQKIMEIYSPEMSTAQENLLFLTKSDPQNRSFIETARQKLLLLGMRESELNKIIATGQPLHSVGVYSRYSGHVHDAGMENETSSKAMNIDATQTQELALREGMYVTKGQTLFMIMNHHAAWAAIEIFPNDQPVVRKGDAVRLVPETDPDAVVAGRIDFIEPFFRRGNKSLTARVYFQNMDMLPIGSQVTATIDAQSPAGLWLPQSSVLSLGVNNVVFIKSPGGFLAHRISAGFRSDDKVQVISGLSAGDTVALNAQYLMDSETSIKTVSK